MSIILKQEVERLEKLVSMTKPGTVEYSRYKVELSKVKESLKNYKPAQVIGSVCESCEG